MDALRPVADRAAAVLARLQDLHPRIIDLSLERVERLLDALGRPQDRLPPVVHIAGTNGKGSTVAFLKAAFEAAGHRVHTYTSPHLVRFNERIVLAGQPIADAEMADLLEEVEDCNAGGNVTFFEVTTAAAFLAFARTQADVLLLETGLGGRLDATNVVARPRLSVITPISHDHHQYLGDSLAGIAAEKAGILKPQTPAVIGRQPEEATTVLLDRAAELSAPLYRHGTEWTAEAEPTGMRYDGRRGTLSLPAPGLVGPHQIDNAGLAVACLDLIEGFAVDEAAIGRGVAAPLWPARLQRLHTGPMIEAAPDDWELWLDGGHNGAAGEALAAVAAGWSERPLHLIVAMLDSKKPDDFIRPLASHAATLTAVPVPGVHATIAAVDLADCARSHGLEASQANDVATALRRIVARAAAPARVLICGSLYLAGAVLSENG